MNKNNLIGQRFGKLVVLEDSGKRDASGRVFWFCLCDCKNNKTTRGDSLKSGNTTSCGCYRGEYKKIKHGDTRIGQRTKLYRIWVSMKNRCYRASSNAYKYYGGKGIAVCDEWRDNYVAFKFWAMLSGYQGGLTIDRIDSAGNYEPNNCQWITRSENTAKSQRERWNIQSH